MFIIESIWRNLVGASFKKSSSTNIRNGQLQGNGKKFSETQAVDSNLADIAIRRIATFMYNDSNEYESLDHKNNNR